MRQIDNMTPQELETLHLKGMLADNKAKPILSAMLDASESFADPAPNKAKHSPLPWTMDVESYSSPSGVRYKSNAVTSGGRILGKLAGFSGSDAALIVRAVNHADKLAKAIGKIRTAMDRGLDLTPSIYGAIDTLKAYESEAQ